MGRYKDATLRREFPELFDGAYVEMRNPALVPWGEARDIREEAPEDATEEYRGRLFLGRMIVSWNLPPTDAPDDDPIPVPARPEDLDRIPALVYLWMVDQADFSPNGQAPGGNRSERRSRGAKGSKTRTTRTGS